MNCGPPRVLLASDIWTPHRYVHGSGGEVGGSVERESWHLGNVGNPLYPDQDSARCVHPLFLCMSLCLVLRGCEYCVFVNLCLVRCGDETIRKEWSCGVSSVSKCLSLGMATLWSSSIGWGSWDEQIIGRPGRRFSIWMLAASGSRMRLCGESGWKSTESVCRKKTGPGTKRVTPFKQQKPPQSRPLRVWCGNLFGGGVCWFLGSLARSGAQCGYGFPESHLCAAQSPAPVGH